MAEHLTTSVIVAGVTADDLEVIDFDGDLHVRVHRTTTGATVTLIGNLEEILGLAAKLMFAGLQAKARLLADQCSQALGHRANGSCGA